MPDAPKTPHRTIRVEEDLWTTFREQSGDASAVLRDFMRWYIRTPGATMPKRPPAPDAG